MPLAPAAGAPAAGEPAVGEPAAPEPAGLGVELPAAPVGGVELLPACGIAVAIAPAAELVVPALIDVVGFVIDALPADGASPAAGGVGLPLQAAKPNIMAHTRHFGVPSRQFVTVNTRLLS